ncbi:MAG: hypothetical protein RI931_96 [Actinomycetota bacterium]
MRALVTGSNSGLGFHTAVALAQDNYAVVLAVRSESRGNAAAKRIRAIVPGSHIEVAHLDLSSLKSVQQFVAGQNTAQWSLLINNAGAKIERPFKPTEDGFEWHTGVNHLGHFALTAGLWPSRAKAARVVTVSSIVATRAKLSPTSIAPETFDEGKAYADSKFLNLLFAFNLARLIDEAGISAVSVAAHPGFARAEPYGTKITRAAELLLAQTAKRGAENIVRASSGSNGEYFAPRIFQLWGESTLVSRPIKAMDLQLMKDQWANAEETTHTRFVV